MTEHTDKGCNSKSEMKRVKIQIRHTYRITEKESIKALKDALKVQCSDGNWNYDPYMHGMANGMIFALSLFEAGRPEYLEAPEVWGEAHPNTDKPICEAMKDG